MTAGRLRERLAFERRVEIEDGAGNFEGAWVEYFTVWARVRPLRGTETVLAQRLQGVQPVVITVRASLETRNITTTWRARDSRTGVTYNLTAVTPAERGDLIDLLATSGQADG